MASLLANTRAGRVAVKICGLTRPELALAAAELGADMAGVVFAPSRRQVSLDTAKQIRRALAERERATGERPLLVGVFVNEPPDVVVRVAAEVGLDVVQLSGDESPDDAARCAQRFPVIKALRFSHGEGAESALGTVARCLSLAPAGRVLPLLDAHLPGAYGGTGRLADWSLAAALAAHYPVILAGGLAPGNVAQAIAAAAPWGIDVSSGVEREQTKDPHLMRLFIDTVRACAAPVAGAGAAAR